jgi:hypothetical protein
MSSKFPGDCVFLPVILREDLAKRAEKQKKFRIWDFLFNSSIELFPLNTNSFSAQNYRRNSCVATPGVFIRSVSSADRATEELAACVSPPSFVPHNQNAPYLLYTVSSLLSHSVATPVTRCGRDDYRNDQTATIKSRNIYCKYCSDELNRVIF